MKLIKILLLLFIPAFLFAEIDPSNQVDSILTPIISATAVWRETFVPVAKWVFGTLLLIDLVITLGPKIVENNGGMDFGALFAFLLTRSLLVGFVQWLWQDQDVLASIPASFAKLADKASSVSVSPDSVLNVGMQIVKTIWDQLSIIHPADALLLVVVGAILLIAFTLMAAQLLIVYSKIHIMLAIAPLSFALAGLGYTRNMAFAPIIAIVKAGMELMLLQLLMGLAVTHLADYAAKADIDSSSMIAMVTTAVLLASITMMVQGIVESVLSGSLAANSTSGFGIAQSVASAGAGMAVGAASMGMAYRAASGLASAQQAAGVDGASAAVHFMKAAKNDLKNAMAGGNNRGTMGGRMYDDLDVQKRAQTKFNEENKE